MTKISAVCFGATSNNNNPKPKAERTDPYCEFNGQRYYLKDTERANRGGYYAGALMLALASLLSFGSMFFMAHNKAKPNPHPDPVPAIKAPAK